MSLIIELEIQRGRVRIGLYDSTISSRNHLSTYEYKSITRATNRVIDEIRAWYNGER